MSHYDRLETRDRKTRRETLAQALPVQIEHARKKSAWYARLLADIDPEDIDSRAALATLPVTRSHQLRQQQQQSPPFGGFAALGKGGLARVYALPGSVYGLEARRSDYWRMARAMCAAGFREGDLIHNSLPYHLLPEGFMLESGAQELGCAVIAAGESELTRQVQALFDLRPSGFAGRTTVLTDVLEYAVQHKLNPGTLKRALLFGCPPDEAQQRLFRQIGIETFYCYATAELGLIAYETTAHKDLVIDEGIVAEIVVPGGHQPVADGDYGELVITTFNPDYPLVRFSTGERSRILTGQSECGRTNMRLETPQGPANQTLHLNGRQVTSAMLAEVLRRHQPRLHHIRLLLEREHILILACEADAAFDGVVETLYEQSGLRADVRWQTPGTLAKDGLLIDPSALI